VILILSQILNFKKEMDTGLIDVGELRRILGLTHTKAYNLRTEILRDLYLDVDKLLRDLKNRDF
jgi:hypothetical protein